MTDLRERFDAADLIPVDDIWADVTRRAAGGADAEIPFLVVPRQPERRRRDGWRKVATIAAALVLALVSIAVVVRAFRSAPVHEPAATESISQARGWIACGGHPLVAIDPNSSAGSVNQIQLTADREVESPLAWSTDGSRLLVDRDSRGGHYRFVLNEDGTEIRLEPVSTVPDMSSFTPSGGRVIYGNDGAIYAVDVDAHTVHLIARGGPLLPEYLQTPSLSPDGSRIAYMRLVDGHSQGLWVMNADGSERRLVSRSLRLGDFGPLVWSPDGTRLAIQSYTAQHHRVIDVIGLDGSGLTRLAGHATSPSWSPDGSRIAFTDTSGHLMTMNADGSDVRDLGVACSGIAWNPVPEPVGP